MSKPEIAAHPRYTQERMDPVAEGRRIQESIEGFSTPRMYEDPATEDIVGKRGEHAFAREFGLPVKQVYGKGDGGWDFDLGFGPIDVKTSQFRKHLLVKVSDTKKRAVIYVGCHADKDTGRDELTGWEFAGNMHLCPIGDFRRRGNPHPNMCHFKLIEELRPIALLHEHREFWRCAARSVD